MVEATSQRAYRGVFPQFDRWVEMSLDDLLEEASLAPIASLAPFPQPVQELDEEALGCYDLAPDKVCRHSLHPDHHHCGAVARYEVSGLDPVCDMKWMTHACQDHAVDYFEAAIEGGWCVCTDHVGHPMIDVLVRRLV